jgi:hypothetical protein
MKRNILLVVMSLLSILLLSIHVTQDVIRGIDPWGRQSLIGVLILVILLHGTLVLAERRSGLIIMLIGGLMAVAMPVIHSRVSLAKSGTFLYVWTLVALGVIGSLTVILAARGLRRRRLGGADGTMTAIENENPDRRG